MPYWDIPSSYWLRSSTDISDPESIENYRNYYDDYKYQISQMKKYRLKSENMIGMAALDKMFKDRLLSSHEYKRLMCESMHESLCESVRTSNQNSKSEDEYYNFCMKFTIALIILFIFIAGYIIFSVLSLVVDYLVDP